VHVSESLKENKIDCLLACAVKRTDKKALHCSGVTVPLAEEDEFSIWHKYAAPRPADDEKMTMPVPGDTETLSTVPVHE